jgi:hypothetical protein
MPALACSLSDVFAGCGVLKPLKRFGLGASGAWNNGALAVLSLSLGVLSLFWDAPNMLLKSGAGVLAGLASPAKRLGLGVSGAALLVCSAGFALLKKLGVAGVCSCAFGVSCVWPKLNFGALAFVDVCSPEKRLPEGAGAGVLAPPNMFVDGAGDAGSAGFGAAEPKLKRLVEGAAAVVAGVLSVPCVLGAPKPNMFFCGVAAAGVLSLFCASVLAPNPPKAGAAAGVALFCEAPPKLKMLVEAGAGVLVLAGAAELVAPNWKDGAGVLEAAGVDELLAPKLKAGCVAGAGVLGAAAADELAPPKVKGVDAPLVVPNMLVEPEELVVLFCSAPPKGLTAGWLPNIEAPKAGGADAPFVGAAPPFRPPKGLFVDDAGEKSKPPEGAWKPLLWLPAPNDGAGNELLVKVLLELDDCAGGKLLVALPKALPPPNMLLEAPLSPPPPMGAEAPKPKLGCCCPPPKLTLCDRPDEAAPAARRGLTDLILRAAN